MFVKYIIVGNTISALFQKIYFMIDWFLYYNVVAYIIKAIDIVINSHVLGEMPPAVVIWMNEICPVIKKVESRERDSKEIAEGNVVYG